MGCSGTSAIETKSVTAGMQKPDVPGGAGKKYTKLVLIEIEKQDALALFLA